MIDILGYLDKAFLEPWRVVVVSVQAGGDSANAGIILAIILCILWAFMLWMLKIIIWDVVFPRIRFIDQYGNRIKVARIYFRARSSKLTVEKSKKEYYWGKFRIFPPLLFHKIMIDKDKFRTRRMPRNIDVFTSGMNLKFDSKEKCYIVDDGKLEDIFDEKKPYLEIALEDIKTVGDLVVEGVRGDFGLIKKKFKLGLSVKKLSDHNAKEEAEEDATADKY